MSEIDVSKCDYYFQGRCGVSKNINYEKEECGLQSPLAKLDAISNIIKQAKEGGECKT